MTEHTRVHAGTDRPGVDLTMMTLIHAALRRDLDRLTTAVAAVEPANEGRVEALRERWSLFAKLLHHHHAGEDQRVWPLIADRIPDRSVLDALETEHATLDPLVAQAGDGFDRLKADSSVPARDALAASLGELRDRLGAHLGHEERDGVPLILAHVGPEEWAAYELYQKNALGPQEQAQFFPWVIEGASADHRETALGVLPAPARVLAATTWEPAYRARVAAAFGS